MLLKRFYDAQLAQASYLIGCQRTGEAVVVDPNRDVQPYLDAAAAEGLRVTHVTETHIHADFVSGARELARRAGARLFLSAEGGDDWQYAYAAEDGATLVRDGDRITVGNVRLDVLHTPGHTPEHLSFVVTDGATADRPMGVLTGDFVFVGDVGRPDLLEKAAGHAGTMDAAARTLFHSLQRFKRLDDWLQLWPGHGAGSPCGKALGSVPQSTLGYERRFNPALLIDDEDAFVRFVLAGQPEPPTYFAQMKRVNRDGPRLLGSLARPRHLPGPELAELLARGATVVDTRPAEAFASRHVPGTINIPLNRSFATWAGWLLPYDADVYLLVGRERPEHELDPELRRDDEACIDRAVRELALIGLDRVAGYLTGDALTNWVAGGRALASVPQTTAADLAARLDAGDVARGALAVVDVRGHGEWEAGHLPGVPNIPVGLLPSHLAELPRDRELVMQCQSGARSAIAASVLRAHGFERVTNLQGGFVAWSNAGLPVERAAEEAAVAVPA